MNDKLKQMAEQAGFVNINADYWDCTTPGIEKLAELIIRECAEIANEPGARIPGYYIKKHFGLE